MENQYNSMGIDSQLPPAVSENTMIGEPLKMESRWVLPKILTGVAAVLLVGGVATASYFVSSRLATGSGLTPNAPESQAEAAGKVIPRGTSVRPTSTRTPIGPTRQPTKTGGFGISIGGVGVHVGGTTGTGVSVGGSGVYLGGARPTATRAPAGPTRQPTSGGGVGVAVGGVGVHVGGTTGTGVSVGGSGVYLGGSNTSPTPTLSGRLTPTPSRVRTPSPTITDKGRPTGDSCGSNGTKMPPTMKDTAYGDEFKAGDCIRAGSRTVIGSPDKACTSGYNSQTCPNWDPSAGTSGRGCISGYYPCGEGGSDCCKIGN